MNDIASIFPRRLRDMREARRLTVNQLSCKTHIPESTIRAYEVGIAVPSIVKAAILANALGVTMDLLCGNDK